LWCRGIFRQRIICYFCIIYKTGQLFRQLVQSFAKRCQFRVGGRPTPSPQPLAYKAAAELRRAREVHVTSGRP
jgi:hypothetical protein